MSTTNKKPIAPNLNGRRPSTDPLKTSDANSRNTARSPAPAAPSVPSVNTNGIVRSPSIRSSPVSARAAARKPPTHRSHMSQSAIATMSNEFEDEDERAETAILIEDLKTQLHKAETTSEEYIKQIGVLQSRLDDALNEQGKLEDQMHRRDAKIETLQNQAKESAKDRKDMEQMYEADRAAMIRDKDQQAGQEEELHVTIQRLKETIAQRDLRSSVEHEGKLSRSSSFRHRSSPDIGDGQFAPSASIQRSPSRNNSKIILQKDKLIESLRLELAESQIRLVEMENMGGGRLQELERTLLETRMANARLMEDNESFQLLLSEKTLNGDFSKADFMQEGHLDDKPTESGSLADELESADQAEGENYRRIEAEAKALKDQNKALTLYIERIIGRLLQHEGFEAILDKADSPLTTTATQRAPADVEKELPPPPPTKDEPPAQATPSFLQRARSVVAGPGKANPRARPQSYMPPARDKEAPPTPHENPHTAPSIPLGRSNTMKGHQRSRSDQADASAAAVVSQMYRGPASNVRATSGGAMSPGISPGSPGLLPRANTYFQLSSGSAASPSRGALGPGVPAERSSRSSNESTLSDDRSGDIGTGTTSSPPRNNAGPNIPGAVMTQSKLRPLRLVQENKEMGSGDQGGGVRTPDADETAKKKANRGSWMGWMNTLGRGPAQEENQKERSGSVE